MSVQSWQGCSCTCTCVTCVSYALYVLCMSSAILGPHIDIHTGGVDLKFPHHDNEIAQAEVFMFSFVMVIITTVHIIGSQPR